MRGGNWHAERRTKANMRGSSSVASSGASVDDADSIAVYSSTSTHRPGYAASIYSNRTPGEDTATTASMNQSECDDDEDDDDEQSRPGAYAISHHHSRTDDDNTGLGNTRSIHSVQQSVPEVYEDEDEWDPTQPINYPPPPPPPPPPPAPTTGLDDDTMNATVEQYTGSSDGIPYSPHHLADQQRRSRKTRLWYSIISLLVLVAVILVVVLYFVLDNGGGGGGSSEDGDKNAAPPTTSKCDFSSVLGMPDPFDQCDCVGRISIITSDVERQYQLLRNVLLRSFDSGNPITSCTNENKALVWLSRDLVISTATQGGVMNTSPNSDIILTERYLLAYLFSVWSGPLLWHQKDKWLSIESACNWYGISCDDDEGRVSSISLSNNNLQGQFVSEVGLFTSLKTLQLDSNNLRGEIPSEIWSLDKLEQLLLNTNRLEGSLSSQVGNSTNLRVLDVASNSLSGTIPSSLFLLGDSLEEIKLHKNSFVGSLPENDNGTVMTALTRLDLSNNEISGTFPESWPSQLINLKLLLLDENRLGGILPEAVGDMGSLEILHLQFNKLSGMIPTTLGRMSALVRLRLAFNQFQSTIPLEFINMTSLMYLYLGSAKIEGILPTELGLMTPLIHLHVSLNNIEGTIPSELGLLRNLAELLIERNDRLVGPIPPEICENKPSDFVLRLTCEIGVTPCSCCVCQ